MYIKDLNGNYVHAIHGCLYVSFVARKKYALRFTENLEQWRRLLEDISGVKLEIWED